MLTCVNSRDSHRPGIPVLSILLIALTAVAPAPINATHLGVSFVWGYMDPPYFVQLGYPGVVPAHAILTSALSFFGMVGGLMAVCTPPALPLSHARSLLAVESIAANAFQVTVYLCILIWPIALYVLQRPVLITPYIQITGQTLSIAALTAFPFIALVCAIVDKSAFALGCMLLFCGNICALVYSGDRFEHDQPRYQRLHRIRYEALVLLLTYTMKSVATCLPPSACAQLPLWIQESLCCGLAGVHACYQPLARFCVYACIAAHQLQSRTQTVEVLQFFAQICSSNVQIAEKVVQDIPTLRTIYETPAQAFARLRAKFYQWIQRGVDKIVCLHARHAHSSFVSQLSALCIEYVFQLSDAIFWTLILVEALFFQGPYALILVCGICVQRVHRFAYQFTQKKNPPVLFDAWVLGAMTMALIAHQVAISLASIKADAYCYAALQRSRAFFGLLGIGPADHADRYVLLLHAVQLCAFALSCLKKYLYDEVSESQTPPPKAMTSTAIRIAHAIILFSCARSVHSRGAFGVLYLTYHIMAYAHIFLSYGSAQPVSPLYKFLRTDQLIFYTMCTVACDIVLRAILVVFSPFYYDLEGNAMQRAHLLIYGARIDAGVTAFPLARCLPQLAFMSLVIALVLVPRLKTIALPTNVHAVLPKKTLAFALYVICILALPITVVSIIFFIGIAATAPFFIARYNPYVATKPIEQVVADQQRVSWRLKALIFTNIAILVHNYVTGHLTFVKRLIDESPIGSLTTSACNSIGFHQYAAPNGTCTFIVYAVTALNLLLVCILAARETPRSAQSHTQKHMHVFLRWCAAEKGGDTTLARAKRIIHLVLQSSAVRIFAHLLLFLLVASAFIAAKSVDAAMYLLIFLLEGPTANLPRYAVVHICTLMAWTLLSGQSGIRADSRLERFLSIGRSLPHSVLVIRESTRWNARFIALKDIFDTQAIRPTVMLRLLDSRVTQHAKAWALGIYLVIFAVTQLMRSYEAAQPHTKFSAAKDPLIKLIPRSLIDLWRTSTNLKIILSYAWILAVALYHRRSALGLWYVALWVTLVCHNHMASHSDAPGKHEFLCLRKTVHTVICRVNALVLAIVTVSVCMDVDLHLRNTLVNSYSLRAHGHVASACAACQWKTYLMQPGGLRNLCAVALNYVLISAFLRDLKSMYSNAQDTSPLAIFRSQQGPINALLLCAQKTEVSHNFAQFLLRGRAIRPSTDALRLYRYATVGYLGTAVFAHLMLTKRFTFIICYRISVLVFIIHTPFFQKIQRMQYLIEVLYIPSIVAWFLSLVPSVHLYFLANDDRVQSIGRAIGVFHSLNSSAAQLAKHVDNDRCNVDMAPFFWYALIVSYFAIERLVYSKRDFFAILDIEFQRARDRKLQSQRLKERIECMEAQTSQMFTKEHNLGTEILFHLKRHFSEADGQQARQRPYAQAALESSTTDDQAIDALPPAESQHTDAEISIWKQALFKCGEIFLKQQKESIYALQVVDQGDRAASAVQSQSTTDSAQPMPNALHRLKQSIKRWSAMVGAARQELQRFAGCSTAAIRSTCAPVPLLFAALYELLRSLIVHTDILVAATSLFYFVSSPSLFSLGLSVSVLCYGLCSYPFAGVLYWRFLQWFSFGLLVVKVLYYICGRTNLWGTISIENDLPAIHSFIVSNSYFYKFYIPHFYDPTALNSNFHVLMKNYSFFVGNTYSLWDLLIFLSISLHIYTSGRYMGCYEALHLQSSLERFYVIASKAQARASLRADRSAWRRRHFASSKSIAICVVRRIEAIGRRIYASVASILQRGAAKYRRPVDLQKRLHDGQSYAKRLYRGLARAKSDHFIASLGLRKNSSLFADGKHKASVMTGIVKDYYTYYFLCDFVAFILFVPSYYRLSGQTRGSLLNSVNDNLLPGTIVISSLFAVSVFILDRVLYLKKNFVGKYALQFTLCMIYLSTYFYWYTHQITIPPAFPVLAGTLLLIKGSYFIFSALQLRFFEFPQIRRKSKTARPRASTYAENAQIEIHSEDPSKSSALPFIGTFFDRSQYHKDFLTHRQDRVAYVSYMVFWSIPFFFELKNYLDWLCTATSLRIYQWFRLEDIYHALFIRKIELADIKTFHRQRGGRYSFPLRRKILTGGVIFMFLIAALFFPLFYFSTFNPNLSANEVTRSRMALSFGGGPIENTFFCGNSEANHWFDPADFGPIGSGLGAKRSYPGMKIEPLRQEDISSMVSHFPLLYNNYYDVNYQALKSAQRITFPRCSATPWKISPHALDIMLRRWGAGKGGDVLLQAEVERKYGKGRRNAEAPEDGPGDTGKVMKFTRSYQMNALEQRRLSAALQDWQRCLVGTNRSSAEGMRQPSADTLRKCQAQAAVQFQLQYLYTPFTLNTPNRVYPLPEADDFYARYFGHARKPNDFIGNEAAQAVEMSHIRDVVVSCNATMYPTVDPLTSSYVSLYWCLDCEDIVEKVRQAGKARSAAPPGAGVRALARSLYFIVFSDKIPTSIHYLTNNSSIIALYTTVIIVIGRLLRGITTGSNYKLVIAEISNTKPLEDIMNCVYLARKNKEFKLENDLYNELMDLMRDPGRLFKQTGRLRSIHDKN